MNSRRHSFHLSFPLLAACLLATQPGCSHIPFTRHKENPAEVKTETAHLKTNAQGLAVEVKSFPDPLKLGEVRQLEVTVILRNLSKQPVHLNFRRRVKPSKFELREPNSGKVLSKWSTDRIFNADSRYLLINPGERLGIQRADHHA